MAKWLTKSDYLKFLIHPAYLWLAKYAKDELPEFNEVAQANVDQGNAVEAVAVSLWPGGHEVDVPMFDGPDESARQMRDGGPDVLFQPSVLTDRRLYVRSDVMVRRGSTWDLYEIKGAASVKTAHLLDLAFQRYVWEEAGYKIGRSFVVHINAQYVRDGEIDPEKLFTTMEVTDQIEPLAFDAARRATDVVRLNPGWAPGRILAAAHEALRGTRGAAMGVARVSPGQGTLTFAGVGNIEGTVVWPGGSKRLTSHNGTLGFEVSHIQEFTDPWPDDAIVILYSDGLGSHWSLDRYPGLLGKDPSLLAGVLYRDCNRGYDDTTVVAVSERRGASA